MVKLILKVLLPLSAGLLIRARFGHVADGLEHAMRKVSMFSMILMLALFTAANFAAVLNILHFKAILEDVSALESTVRNQELHKSLTVAHAVSCFAR